MRSRRPRVFRPLASGVILTLILTLVMRAGETPPAPHQAEVSPPPPGPDLCEPFIYHPRPVGADLGRRLAAVVGRKLPYVNAQGRQTAYWVPPLKQTGRLPDAVWILTAGNGSLATDWLEATRESSPRIGWLLVDYPSYGECEGHPNPDRIRANYEDAYGLLVRELNTSREELLPRTGAFGHSLGAAAALDGAATLGLKRVVVLAPFTSLRDMARKIAGNWSVLVTHRYDNRARIDTLAAAGAKVVIFHGTDDEVIPFAQGEALARRQPQAVELVRVEGGNHNNLPRLATSRIGAALGKLSGF